MGIKTIKVLRIISKVILAVFVLAFVGYGGLVTYKSIINRPQRVRITNVTDSAATITWVTKNPVRGVVYYNENGFFLPGPLSFIFGKAAYDDRDVSAAQEACVAKFNENAKNTKDANFSVDGSDFNCENAKIEKIGAYYTHSVTVPNLKEETKYSFRVGNGIWSWDYDGVNKNTTENDLPLAMQFNFATESTSETVPTPNIAYGTVYAVKNVDNEAIVESDSKDALVFAFLTINGENTPYISGVTNTDGGWILDKSNFRDTGGDLITDLSDAKLTLCAQYEAVETTRCLEVSDNLNDDTSVDLPGNLVDDLTPYEKIKILEWFDGIVSKVYAVSYDPACHTNCGGPQAPNCTAGSGCVKNCFNKCVGSNEWVSTGGVLKSLGEAASAPNCSMPASCGCTPGTCEEKCDNGTRRTCMSGHYWSVWVAGSCTPSKCDDNDDDNLKCEDDNGALVNPGSTCSNGKKCVNGECNGSTGGGCSSNCSQSDLEKGCQKLSDTTSKQCNYGNGCYTWKSYSNSATCGVDINATCADGTTKVGYCTYGSKKCTTKGGALVVSDSCKCKDGNNLVLVGGCIGLTQHTCGITSNGSVAPTVSTFAGCPGAETLPEKCSLKPEYKGCLEEGTKCLESCTLTCNDGPKTLAPKECKKLSSDIKDPIYTIDPEYDGNIQVISLNLADLDKGDLSLLFTVNPAARAAAIKELNQYIKSSNNWKCGDDESDKKQMKKFCGALGGKIDYTIDAYCITDQSKFQADDYSCPGVQSLNWENFVSRAYAQDNNSDGYTLYLPEYAMYSFELGNYKLTTETSDGKTSYLFYIEANGKDGFQMPEDPDNPTSEEDIMLKSNSAMITYEKVSSAQKYTIAKGINLVSFNFIPVSTELGTLTADGVIKEAAKKNVTIKYISTFDGGRWSGGYSCQTSPCTGNDFTIIPGKGYLIYATTEGDITIPGYNLKSSIPVAFSSGWNLVGIHGYTTAYTARTLIDSINKIEGLTANNVSWWPTSKGKYEGLQVENNTEYGLDFAISPTNGYFVRISEFAPSDTTCKSILWNDGGTLNGTCGNTK